MALAENEGAIARFRAGKGIRSGVVDNGKISLKSRIKTEFLVRVGLPLSDRITINSRVAYKEGFLEETLPQMVESGDLIVAYSGPHDTYYNADSLSMVTLGLTLEAKALREEQAKKNQTQTTPFNGFVVPVAASLPAGKQGYMARRFFEAGESRLNRRFLFTTPVTRNKDQKKYEMAPDKKVFMANITYAIRNNFGIAVLPAGRRDSGRKNERGERTGMVPFEKDCLSVILKAANKAGMEVYFLPVGTDGGVDILEPDTFKVSPEAWKAGFRVGDPHLVDIVVDEPIHSTAMLKDGRMLRDLALSRNQEDLALFNDILGGAVAKLINPNMQGVYAQSVGRNALDAKKP